MECFYYFKNRLKPKERRSAPELERKSDSSAATTDRVAKSSCSANSPRGIPELYEEKAHNLRVFSFSELRQATNDFSRLLKIGEGGFGCVYKGSIKPVDRKGEPVQVAIKKLNRDGLQGHKQWIAEVQFLGVVEHANLVKLIGYCSEDSERGRQHLLVLRILLGAAQGLAYLHEGLEVQVIHRDYKSSNVLLDEDFKPKLSDFGLAREGPTHDRTHVSTAVVGTHGYAAPDYIETGHLTTKSDVWSFGVVLYEVLTGRRSLERNRPRTEQKLLEWVKHYPADSKKFSSIIDPRLENQYSISAARKIAKLADSCLLKSSKDRPKMSQVVHGLQEIIQVSGAGDDANQAADRSSDFSENEPVDSESKPGESGTSESWKRRMAHLAKLGEHVESASRRRFMIMQRARVQ
ncbi:probable serine/threonine-protein kinase PBL19 isoform X2 [Syzygium oleosum]|uniref:probable serine/threonine-protein kinase PBL19 isoform X2 n=1 Tax=Syzygium oleosum TaxID=219896 RepID=UPI0024BBBB96|nr:probable serine/threonine-protein kinase PBL19 isoform X2 [Syzygium oleosum]